MNSYELHLILSLTSPNYFSVKIDNAITKISKKPVWDNAIIKEPRSKRFIQEQSESNQTNHNNNDTVTSYKGTKVRKTIKQLVVIRKAQLHQQ